MEDNFRKKLNIFRKKTKNVEWVTNVDIAAEEVIRKTIKDNFPSHDILGEEGEGRIGKGFTWVIDPLDGTSNYIMGFSFFSVSLALLEEEKPILVIIYNPIASGTPLDIWSVLLPISKELYLAEKGKGAYLNRRKVKVNRIDNLSETLLFFNSERYAARYMEHPAPYKGKDLEEGLKILTKISSHIRTVRFLGSANLEVCQVAAGKSEGFIAIDPAYHDVGVGSFMVEEAGGKVTDFEGKKYTLNSPNIIVTNGKIHNQLLKIINEK